MSHRCPLKQRLRPEDVQVVGIGVIKLSKFPAVIIKHHPWPIDPVQVSLVNLNQGLCCSQLAFCPAVHPNKKKKEYQKGYEQVPGQQQISPVTSQGSNNYAYDYHQQPQVAYYHGTAFMLFF